MKNLFLAEKTRMSVGFIEDYHFPSGWTWNFLQFSHRNYACLALWLAGFPPGTRKPARQIAGNANLDGRALDGRFENPATPHRSVRSDFQNARPVLSQTWFRTRIIISISWVKKMSFNQIKRQEAQSRMAAIRRARRSPAAAAAEQRRASLVGNGAKWRITNLNEAVRAMAKHWGWLGKAADHHLILTVK
jgi:hypothetical protein